MSNFIVLTGFRTGLDWDEHGEHCYPPSAYVDGWPEGQEKEKGEVDNEVPNSLMAMPPLAFGQMNPLGPMETPKGSQFIQPLA